MANSRPQIPAQRTRLAWRIATCGGLGFLRPGPGTWTSLATAIVWFACSFQLRDHRTLWLILSAGFLLLSVAVGIPASTVAARESSAEDPGFVTVDELAGQWLALLFWPALWKFGWTTPQALLWQAGCSFVLFRIFDIAKPWPIRRLEKLHGGTGIMLDDLGAGVYACMVQALIIFVMFRVMGDGILSR